MYQDYGKAARGQAIRSSTPGTRTIGGWLAAGWQLALVLVCMPLRLARLCFNFGMWAIRGLAAGLVGLFGLVLLCNLVFGIGRVLLHPWFMP